MKTYGRVEVKIHTFLTQHYMPVCQQLHDLGVSLQYSLHRRLKAVRKRQISVNPPEITLHFFFRQVSIHCADRVIPTAINQNTVKFNP
jgi:hypothetical protein